MKIETLIKRTLPRSLLGRSLLILVVPMVLLQVISAFIFYEAHWDKVSKYLARGLAGDVGAMVDLVRDNPTPQGRARAFEISRNRFNMDSNLRIDEILSNSKEIVQGSIPDPFLLLALKERVGLPYHIIAPEGEKHLTIEVQLSDGILAVTALRKRLFSSTTYVFVLWMLGSSLLLFGVAIVFMRNQVRPIRRLAVAADAFGKRQDVERFKPEGAREVRQAAMAFLLMKGRIERQIEQRTHMLAGVSHDLRTPLTRMKLQLAMMGDDEDVKDLSEDIHEMEHMLEGYLAFARGEGGEATSETNLSELIESIVSGLKRKGVAVDYHCEGKIFLQVRPNAFRRCVTNLVENAARYGEHLSVRLGQRHEMIEVTVDDDGPGIPAEKYEEVFKPFFRLDKSRNIQTGGVGLGLSIVRDVVRTHGGDIQLSTSPQGGLRARLRFPV
ncbi:putative two-component sensor histidine kinase [Candidatus Terasakiella magnetica]|uniref:histidine kinase n=1 Tax=Candidatus Terasakiella magnetica TaxID=1867952 RepID=A0A1C3RLM2_9PROT|nr:ATP-binding protein [Candidatus Terasakiella magnetica]SCA58202.1 putative two-component sensor histidine kinase [Candidatus Terasakiella magnetica]